MIHLSCQTNCHLSEPNPSTQRSKSRSHYLIRVTSITFNQKCKPISSWIIKDRQRRTFWHMSRSLVHTLAQSCLKVSEYWACWEKNQSQNQLIIKLKPLLIKKIRRLLNSNARNLSIDSQGVNILIKLCIASLRKQRYKHKMLKRSTLMMVAQKLLLRTKVSKSVAVIVKAMRCVWRTKGHLILTHSYRRLFKHKKSIASNAKRKKEIRFHLAHQSH